MSLGYDLYHLDGDERLCEEEIGYDCGVSQVVSEHLNESCESILLL